MWLVLVHAAAVWFMTGVIWTMQLLNYPLLARIGADRLTGYERAHNAGFAPRPSGLASLSRRSAPLG